LQGSRTDSIGFERFYEKVIKVKADVAALLIFFVLCCFRHISSENSALGSLRSDDWQLARPTAPPLLSVFRVLNLANASSLLCWIDPVVTGGAVKGARKGAFILTLDSPASHFTIEWGTKRNAVQLSFVP
jgi:hypothetical protein